MLPVNLLALDSTIFDTSFKLGPGVQPLETGFSTAFGNLMQAPETGAGPLATFPAGSDALTSWPVTGGEVLPQAGNSLPPGSAVTLPETDPIVGGDLEDSPVLDALAPATAGLPGTRAQVTPAVTETGVPAFPGAIPAAPTDNESATTAPVAAVQTGAGSETSVPADAAHSGLLQSIRYFKTGADAQTRPMPDAGPAVTLQRPDQQSIPQASSTTPQVAPGVQEFSRQVTEAARTNNAMMMPAGAETLPGEGQDLKAAQPSAAPLPSIATIKAPSAANAASPAAPMQWTGSSIDVAPGQDGWSEALGDRVTWMTGNRIQNAELKLNPAELGPLRVQISMDDGNASVTFTAQHPQTREAIEQALPRLREMLADQGVSLQNASVSDQGPRHQQSGQGGEKVAPQLNSAPGIDGGLVEGESLATVMRAPSGLVDVFA